MNIFDFMNANPMLAFFLALPCLILGRIAIVVMAKLIEMVLKVVLVVIPSNYMRYRTIKMHGYPPYHCDVTGTPREPSLGDV